jgi:hypothetical protein
MLGPLKGRSRKSMEKSLPCLCGPWQWLNLRRKHTRSNQSEQGEHTASFPATLHSPKIDTE